MHHQFDVSWWLLWWACIHYTSVLLSLQLFHVLYTFQTVKGLYCCSRHARVSYTGATIDMGVLL
jgi:hypothetical protein